MCEASSTHQVTHDALVFEKERIHEGHIAAVERGLKMIEEEEKKIGRNLFDAVSWEVIK